MLEALDYTVNTGDQRSAWEFTIFNDRREQGLEKPAIRVTGYGRVNGGNFRTKISVSNRQKVFSIRVPKDHVTSLEYVTPCSDLGKGGWVHPLSPRSRYDR